MLRAFLKAPSGVVGLLVLALVLVIVIAAPQLLGVPAKTLDVGNGGQNPSAAHLLGTDALGRDILARLLVATRLSIGLAFAAAALGALIGIPAGAGAAILSPRLRPIALRTIDTALAFPGILVAIFIGAIVGPGILGAALGVGIAISFSFARVSSALALSVGGRDYIAAARVLGIRGPRLLLRYVLPNMADTLAITTTVAISNSIVQVSSLSFLGLGVQAPQFDWGRMLTEGVQTFYTTPAAAVAPAVAIAVSALAFGFSGEALARAMNPVLWARAGDSATNGALAAAAALESARPLAVNVSRAESRQQVLEVSDLTVTFPGPGRPITVVDGVSFGVEKGEIVGIVGESGSGKTMTAMAIAQLMRHPGRVSGSIRILGQDVQRMPLHEMDHFLGTKLAVVFQDPMSSLNPALRIGVQLREGAEVHRNLASEEAVELATTRLHEVNIPTPRAQLAKHPHELSGGMRQRVMIAMGLMNEPALLIADEPTTALDVTIQAQIMDLLWRVNSQYGTAVLLISHNLGLISENCQKVLVMYAGRIVEELTIKQLLEMPRHPYTAALLAAVPDLDQPLAGPLETIPGQAADIAALPPGCPYHPRCALAMDRCRQERPALLARPEGGRVACWVANADLVASPR
jgi:oligopeptide/dipeptide ABC transporter ATP-binding protein